MDTVFVVLNETTQSWWAGNAYWWVPVLTVIVTVLGIFFSTKISIKNTNKQIENSKTSTEKQIKASIKNTNKQIENQKREGKRPLITIKKGSASGSSLYPKYYFRPKGYDIKNNNYPPKNLLLELNNIGYGVALNLRFSDIKIIKNTEKYYISNNKHFIQKEEQDVVFIADLASGEKKGIYLEIEIPSQHKINKDTLLQFSLIYSDLNENYYESVYIVGLTSDFYVCRHIHLPGTEAFNKKVNEIFTKG